MRKASDQTCNRLQALDLVRGAAVAGMILVTSPGSWTFRYHQLDHAAWHGWTLADMVFPTFLFAVGCALALSVPRASIAGARSRIARRSLLLILLGLVLNALPWFDFAHLRIPGILQRIALCYALVAAIVLLTARHDGDRLAVDLRAILLAAALLLIGYGLLLALIPTPGFGAGRLDPEGNFPAWLDRLVFSVDHLWVLGTAPDGRVVYDPEGLLSTLPACVNVLIGVAAATAMRRLPEARRPLWLGLAGVALFAIGLALDGLMPINKRIWTSSFALLSSGFSLALFAALMMVPIGGWARTLASPLRILGGNAILAFVLSQLLGIAGGLPLLPGGESPQAWGFGVAQAMIPVPELASLACALAILALITLIVAPLHRRGLHLRL